MRILVIHKAFCSRTRKQVKALLKNKHEITLMAEAKHFTPGLKRKIKTIDINDASAVQTCFNTFKENFDICHSHNEPNVHTTMALNNKIHPIIFDAHDIDTLRTGNSVPSENFIFPNVDGIVHVNNAIDALSRSVFKIKCPSITVLSCNSKDDFNKKEEKENKFDCVYEGGEINTVAPPSRFLWGYRNYEPIFSDLVKSGLKVFTFSSNRKNAGDNPKVKRFGRVDPHKKMLERISKYSFGLVGFNRNYSLAASGRFLDTAMPNKIFDYMAAGLPMIAFGSVAVMDFVEKNEIGITLGRREFAKGKKILEEKLKKLPYEKMVKNILKLRKKYTMENEIKKLEKFYELLVK